MSPDATLAIGSQMNVDEVLSRFPAVARVFVQRRLHCVGCPMARFETIADVCSIYHLGLDAFLGDLNAAACPAR